jgi:tRNA A37 methylthiotransferase MiaB
MALPSPLPGQVIRERARALRAIAAEKSQAFRQSQSGCELRALTLARRTESWTEALTANFLKVRVAGRHDKNQWHKVRLTPSPDEILPATPIG